MINVLLIWTEIPESLKLYKLVVTEEELVKLRLCHGNLINSTQNNEEQEAALEWLSLFLGHETPIFNDQDDPMEKIGGLKIDEIIYSGFLL